MSNPQKSSLSSGGSAPPYEVASKDEMAMRAPPPSYEESQRSGGAAGYTHQGPAPPTHNQYYGMISHHQQQPTLNGMAYGAGYGPSTSAAAGTSGPPLVLNLDSRAEVGKTIVIPPPPPGYLPTPAQWAAMQGQQVAVKQKKRSFF
ncbi:DAZ-associated protein 2 [Drosophila bipectinata]|uniref:DAZ-associated protein 2 n=1 Tax=Drosophila bipectinata TaxID=42026 RepID=UPI001C8ADED6|nr:pH-response regulator protein palI/RIM9 [Drosophila bipectinata]